MGGDVVCVEEGVEAEGDAKARELAFVPVQQVEDLGAAGLQARKAELAADLGGGLGEFDPVAAFGGGAGGL